MKTHLSLVLSAILLPLTSLADLVVDLDARELPQGDLPVWTNPGALGGVFNATGGPMVTSVDGINAVTYTGTNWHVGPRSTPEMDGGSDRSIQVWLYNPAIAAEETVVSWGHRGGPAGSNMSFNHGTHNTFGAVGHWGDGPDIGWDPSADLGTEDTGLGHEEAGIWTNIGYTQTGQQTRVFTNGVLTKTEDVAISTHPDQVIVIAAQQTGANTNAFEIGGSLSIARVQIWDTTLPDGQFAFNYNQEAANFGRDPAPITDGDGDGIPDDMEEAVGLNPGAADAEADSDGDGLSNIEELRRGSDLNADDTDGDGLLDGEEVAAGTSLLNPDTDGDSLSDKEEVDLGLDPTSIDTDGDGAPDNIEIDAGTDPNDPNDSPSTISLIRSTADTESWETPAVWSSGEAVQEGNQYVIAAGGGSVLNTPRGTTAAFPSGATLSLSGSNAHLVLRNGNGTQFDDLRLQSGSVSVGGTRGGLRGQVTVSGDATVMLGSGKRFELAASLSGSGILRFTQPVGETGVAALTGPSGGFDGEIISNGVVLELGGLNPLGAADLTLQEGGFDLRTNVLLPDSTFSIGGVGFSLRFNGRTIVMRSGRGINAQGEEIFPIPAGAYDREALIELGFNEDTILDDGMLVLLGDTGDTDGDGLWDQWEIDTFGDLSQDAAGDTDGDGLSHADEFRFESDPTVADSDGDGLDDGEEAEVGSDPNLADTDGDGISDADEVNRQVDGQPAPTDPAVADTDGDRLDDKTEIDSGTDPLLADTDGGGWPDGDEVFVSQTDPLDPDDDPDFPPGVKVLLDAAELPEGPLTAWTNLGGLGGDFVAEDGNPTVEVIDGVKGVTFSGELMRGPEPSDDLLGNSSRTIEAWVYNPTIAPEETVISWGRRGGPEGTNMSFNHGTHNAFGAIGHWGGVGPDIGWDPGDQDGDEVTETAQEEANIWTFISYTYNAEETLTSVYTSGQLTNSEDISTGAGNPGMLDTWAVDTAGNPLNILLASQNDDSGAATGDLRGMLSIALLRIYSGALSAEQIAANFERDADRFGRDDSDGDGLGDGWELEHFGNLDANPEDDPDEDGLDNAAEFARKTNPNNADSDGDGFTDLEEFEAFTDPNDPDSQPDPAALMVELDATGLDLGPLSTWDNTGSLGDFDAQGNPEVVEVAGVRGVDFDGIGDYFEGPASAPSMEGRSPRTIEAWVHNPTIAEEETVVAWAQRGGPDGTNVSFNHGSNAAFGAVGHWGAPDIGWNGDQEENIWTFITYSYDGNTTRVYTNGQLSNEENVVLNTFPGNGILIAAQREGDGTTVTAELRGSMTIAKVRVYNYARTGEEIAAAFAGEAAQFGRDDDPDADNDGDGLTNSEELALGTNPNDPDTDNDGFGDNEEVIAGTDPTSAASYPDVPANTLVELDAEGLPEGVLATWANAGTLGGEFAAQGDPTVEIIDGAAGVTLDGAGDWLVGPASTPAIEGASARTVEAWIFNPEIAVEETVVAWARRGGPDGTNVSFNHGTHDAFGAVGHWGNGPDIGWDPTATDDDDPAGDDQEEAGIWTHISYTYDGETTRVYTNGALTNEESPIVLNSHGGQPIVVGAQWENETTINEDLLGSLSVGYLRILDGALSPAQIASAYNERAARFGRDPTGGAFVFSFSFPTEDGVDYQIEYSPAPGTEPLEPNSWIDIVDFTGDGTPFDFVETDATRIAQPEGFYRSVVVE